MKAVGASAFAVIVIVLAVTSADAEAPGQPAHISRGKHLYIERCSDCHGDKGEMRALGRSRPLNRLPPAAISAKLRQHQIARRIRGMKDKMKSGLIEDDIESLAAYIRLFESQ